MKEKIKRLEKAEKRLRDKKAMIEKPPTLRFVFRGDKEAIDEDDEQVLRFIFE